MLELTALLVKLPAFPAQQDLLELTPYLAKSAPIAQLERTIRRAEAPPPALASPVQLELTAHLAKEPAGTAQLELTVYLASYT